MSNKLDDTVILNIERAARKFFKNSDSGDYMAANKKWFTDNVTENYGVWFASHLNNDKMLVQNDSVKPTLKLGFGSSLYNAFARPSSIGNYIYENPDWDGSAINSIKTGGCFYSPNSNIPVSSGYLMKTSGETRDYYSIGNEGIITGIGTYKPVLATEIKYANYAGDVSIEAELDEMFDNTLMNERTLYLYNNIYYTSWNYTTPTNTSPSKANGIYIQRVNAYNLDGFNNNLYYYMQFSNGILTASEKLKSQGYSYAKTPRITTSNISVTANGGSFTMTVTVDDGTYWQASASGCSISNNTKKYNSGNITLTFDKNTSTTNKTCTVTIQLCYPDWTNASEGSKSITITQPGVSYTDKTYYVFFNKDNQSELKLSSKQDGSIDATLPFNLTVKCTVISKLTLIPLPWQSSSGEVQLVENVFQCTFNANSSNATTDTFIRGKLDSFSGEVIDPENQYILNNIRYNFVFTSNISQ